MELRWRFTDPPSPDEAQKRADVIAAIDRFWTGFSAKQQVIFDHLRGRNKFDIAELISPLSYEIHPKLEWEFCPGKAGGEGFAISTGGDRWLQPLVDVIVDRAPEFPKWTIYRNRRPLTVDHALRFTHGRCRRRIDSISFKIAPGEDNLIDIEAYSKAFSGTDLEEDLTAASLAIYYLIGEEDACHWIGEIHSKPARSGFFGLKTPKDLIPAADLRKEIDRHIADVHSKLPDKPYRTWEPPLGPKGPDGRQQIGYVFKVNAPEREEYPFQSDLFVATSSHKELWMATRSDKFASCRYSRFGETFCYIKTDGREGLKDRWQDRGEVEDEITDRLGDTGTVLSGGTGYVYSYIELALSDVDAAIPIIRDVLSKGNINRNTWLLFHDAEYECEWVGIYEDTPPPPFPRTTDEAPV